MAKQVTLGGDRLHSGKRQKIELDGFQRSTFDKSRVWRNTQAPGTLVPCFLDIGLPGDMWDIGIAADVMTHPTLGPLFGSYQLAVDFHQFAMRLYQAQLHNNKLGIGLKMSEIKMPVISLPAENSTGSNDLANSQINPSCILAYLGIRGVGTNTTGTSASRLFNAMPLLGYWDIYKNYYSNKQEEIGAVIHTTRKEQAIITGINIGDSELPEAPTESGVKVESNTSFVQISYSGATKPDITQMLILSSQPLSSPDWLQMSQIVNPLPTSEGVGFITYQVQLGGGWLEAMWYSWKTAGDNTPIVTAPEVHTFPLKNLDDMREAILGAISAPGAFVVNNVGGAGIEPYSLVLGQEEGVNNMLQTQEGLACKTYKSDLLNNWLQTEWIDGENGINEVSAIDVSGGLLYMDALILQKKIYDMLNRIAVSGGTYDDWQDANWQHDRFVRPEIPVYEGGLMQEIIFQEVVSNSASETQETSQPLGTLAGKGTLSRDRQGGHVNIMVNEPSYIMALASITPRPDYSQGNKWHVHVLTMDDLHKPILDQLGFQELITEQMHWADTHWDLPSQKWITKSAGKQTAWLNYQTDIPETYGNFAIESNEMFMTLNRRYEMSENLLDGIEDVTTYIHPGKFNFIFAQTSIDAMNFWVQLGFSVHVRRKMSSKVMPNL